MSMPRSQLVLSVAMFWLAASLCLTNCSSGSSSSSNDANNANSTSSYGNGNSLVGQTLSSTGNASFTATNNGNLSFVVESAVFDAYSPAKDGNVGSVYAFFSSSPNLCLDFNASNDMNFTVAPNTTLTVLQLSNSNKLIDLSVGNFMVNPNTLATGQIASLTVYHFDANCAIDTNLMPSAGTVNVSTLMVGSNANLAGTITDAYLGATNGNLSGSFTATPCGNLGKYFSPGISLVCSH